MQKILDNACLNKNGKMVIVWIVRLIILENKNSFGLFIQIQTLSCFTFSTFKSMQKILDNAFFFKMANG
jgi:hypothetical protein